MKSQDLKQKGLVFILVSILMVTFGTQNISYAQEANLTITASAEAPLTEANLHGSVVTLTLSGAILERSTFRVRDGVTVSGIDGVTVGTFDIDRISDTEVTVELTFSGNIDADKPLVFTVGAEAIVDYDGAALSAQLPITAVDESLVAATASPLTEVTLSGSVVTLTLSGRSFDSSRYDIERALTISGIEGVSVSRTIRVSDTQVQLTLTFSDNMETDATLIITVGASAIDNYDQTLTAQLPVTALTESLVATTESPLTEATLSGSVVTLTLSGRSFTRWSSDIGEALTISGIDGVTVGTFDIDRISDTEVTVEPTFSGNIDTDATLTITVGASAIDNYDQALTAQLPVTALTESLVATTETPLTEVNLSGSVVTLTLSGRNFISRESDIRDALSVTGIEGVSVSRYGVDRVSNTEVTVVLISTEDFDIDSLLTLTVGADAIAGYNEGFSFEFPVTAVEESMTATTEAPLSEATLTGSVVTLTLSGRHFTEQWDIERALTFSGIGGISIPSFDGVERVSNTEAKVTLLFAGNIDTDATLTLTVGADAIIGYNEEFTFQLPVTAVEESIHISSKFDLTEATLGGSDVILTLNGRSFVTSSIDIHDEMLVTGIEGVTVGQYDVDRVSNNQVAVELSFDRTDFDIDSTLTFTVGADAIAGYGEALTAQIPVSAIKQSSATISISPNPIVSSPLSEQLTFSLNISGGKGVAGFQAVVWYDNDTLWYVESAIGNYLPSDAHFVAPTVEEYEYYRYPYVPIAATALDGVRNGNGTLATFTFEVYNDVKESEITLTDVYIVDREGVRWEVEIEGAEVTEPPHDIVGDINRDGIVNIRDLVLAGNRFGLSGENRADINGDGIVDIADLVLVANAIGANAAAPSLNPQVLELLTAADVKEWLTQAQKIKLTDPDYKRGIRVLEQLHKALTPKATALLPNFPNPFNPETWIPYHLAKDAKVTLHIYAMNGTLVRTLVLGHQSAGMYQNRSRAAYWDGKNEFGEPVASGVYFYTLTAGDFTATRKMLIQK